MAINFLFKHKDNKSSYSPMPLQLIIYKQTRSFITEKCMLLFKLSDFTITKLIE